MKGMFVICSILLATVRFTRSVAVGSCPAVNGNVLLPDDKDCSIFYKCNWGKAVLINCPDGLNFNTKVNVCDYPENVNCDHTSTPPGGNEGDEGDEGSDPLFTCPAVAGKYPIYMPDKTDCTKFYVCDHGRPVQFKCGAGLLYDGLHWTCNYPEYVTCGQYSPVGDDGIPGSSGNVSPNPPEENNSSNPWLGECPEVAADEVVLLAGRDPKKFYSCIGTSTPVELSCPVGLIFDVVEQICDFPG